MRPGVTLPCAGVTLRQGSATQRQFGHTGRHVAVTKAVAACLPDVAVAAGVTLLRRHARRDGQLCKSALWPATPDGATRRGADTSSPGQATSWLG
jgi:hypothetical protein